MPEEKICSWYEISKEENYSQCTNCDGYNKDYSSNSNKHTRTISKEEMNAFNKGIINDKKLRIELKIIGFLNAVS